MNKFDKFIEEKDRELKIDTSTRSTTGNDNGNNEKSKNNKKPTGKKYIQSSPQSPSRYSSFLVSQRQFTPIRANDLNGLNDHPLKGNDKYRNGNDHEDDHAGDDDNFDDNTSRTSISSRSSGEREPSRSRSGSRTGAMINKRKSLIQPIIQQNDPILRPIRNNSLRNNQTILNQSQNKNIVQSPQMKLKEFSGQISRNPSTKTIMETDDVHELLKNLANKELELLESKQNIEDLKKQLIYQEKLYEQQHNDLNDLKKRVSKHLNDRSSILATPSKNVSESSIDRNTSAIAKSTESSPRSIRLHESGKVDHPTESNTSKLQRDRNINDSKDITISSPNLRINSEAQNDILNNKKDSMWSKPLAIFNQFDQIIQNELERSLNWDEEANNGGDFMKMHDEDDNDHIIEDEDPGQLNRSWITSSLDQSPFRRNEDIYNHEAPSRRIVSVDESNQKSVSTSIWNFVNDMKEGLLGGTEDTNLQQETSLSNDETIIKEFKTTKKINQTSNNRLQFINAINEEDEGGTANRSVEMASYM